jgi:hypothetical protein
VLHPQRGGCSDGEERGREGALAVAGKGRLFAGLREQGAELGAEAMGRAHLLELGPEEGSACQGRSGGRPWPRSQGSLEIQLVELALGKMIGGAGEGLLASWLQQGQT